MTQIEVYPDKSGNWRHRKREDGKAGKPSKVFGTRAGAFEGALIARQSERIVQLRLDGSEYGELYHENRAGGPPQRVDILAATERNEAVSVSG